ncbi:MAG: hypothetical protein M1825_001856 [Sarcosagium campestre]|nr:MAG: hypothetical protein M1825_001856 [Sarcosagium campestre]
MAGVIPVHNETKSNMTRVTKDGRKLTYQLNVIQQPERARACGSGAKSSADRRPVDPPPVVELRIFEGDAMNDVTFSYNANFFLFTTLEPTRAIAQGRVPQAPLSIPVLTGMPVSGMAYLDRPTAAGYFLFPDLSVRHEGKYRLSFNLYEEVKEAKDADAEPAQNHPDHPNNATKIPSNLAPKAHVDWRLEVRSKPFTVYSAKKFPGLAESTALSRIVAEQGCRVRIRRDVRMRRRDNNKPQPDFSDYDEEAGYVRARATPTPDPYQSSGPQNGHNPADGHPGQHPAVPGIDRPQYNAEPQRRDAPQDPASYAQQPYQHVYNGAPPVMQTAVNSYPQQHYGGSSAAPYSNAQYPSQPLVANPQVYPQQPPAYYQNVPPHQYQSQPGVVAQHLPREGSDGSMTRRASVSYNYQQPTPPASGFGHVDNTYMRSQQAGYQFMGAPPPVAGARTPTPTASGHALPPLKVLTPLEPKHEGNNQAIVPSSVSSSTPLRSPGFEGAHQRGNSFHQYSAPSSTTTESTRPGKRSYAEVFDTSVYDQAFRQGMRPTEAQVGVDHPQTEIDEDEFDSAWEIERMKMKYKRADGTEISRRLCPLD